MTKDFLLRLTEEHYGAGAFPVYGRLLEEQRLTWGGPLLPMWYCTAALRRAFGGENVLVLGCTNDSLLAHLLGATPVNPLPPHYHCPNCHYLIFDAHADDGWDLPDLVCPECGAPMAADGHNLRSRSLIGESVVSLQVPQEQFAPVCAWLRDYWAQRDCQAATEPYSDAEVMGLRLTLPEGVQGVFEVRVLYPTDRLDPLPSDVPPLHTAYRRIKGMGLRLASGAWTGAERDAVERGAWRLRMSSRSGRMCTICCGSTRCPSSGGKTACRGRSQRTCARGSTPRRGCRSRSRTICVSNCASRRTTSRA